jgi:Glycosyltransferase family 9 (heptosyltransferase)
MKKALVTIAAGDYYQRMAALTHPTIQSYADRVGAEFIVWSDVSEYTIAEYKKMEIGGLLDVYDRVLCIDTDVIVRDDAPDIFAAVPEDCLGMLEEGQCFDRRYPMYRLMEMVGRNFDAWDGNYYNSGVFVCSRCHRDVFVRPPVEYGNFGEQTWLNLMICDRQVRMFPLPYRFNRFVGPGYLYGGEDRLDAWFLHYAGVQTGMSRDQVLELIARDLQMWQRTRPRYRYPLHVAIEVDGGLGDQIAAEPAVRYARDVIYRGDDLIVVSSWPEIFRPLNLPVFHQFEQIPGWYVYDRRHTRPDPAARDEVSLHQMHGTNLASRVALGVDLPLACKTPRLSVDPAAVNAVAGLVRPRDVDSLVLLHSGRGAAADTFPPDVWQSFAGILTDHGFHVAVIGKRDKGELGIVEFNRSKCIDLTDKLTIEELIALVSRARALVANDSAPVQIAGAFDGWIGLIATLRHPEYVLPWRNGSQFYRARNLERAELYADYIHEPSGARKGDLDVCDQQRLRACLPEPSAILEFVKSAFAET